jgi:hypothetical protein
MMLLCASIFPYLSRLMIFYFLDSFRQWIPYLANAGMSFSFVSQPLPT